jgi:hypothetical protein
MRQVNDQPTTWVRHASPEVSSNTDFGMLSNDVIFSLIPYRHQNASPCHAEFFPIRTQYPKQKEASTTQPQQNPF